MCKSICNEVGAWLLKPGNSKSGLAESLGITTRSLRNKLNGEQPWLWDEVCTIAEVIGCSLDDLSDKAA